MSDLILTICSIAFGYALVPQIIYGFRNKLGTVTIQTSTVTSAGLYTIAGVYLYQQFWFASVACAATATLWLVLLMQRLVYGPPEK